MSKDNCLWITNGLHIGDTGIMRYQYDPANSHQVLTKVCCRSKQHYDVSEKIDDPELKRLVLTEFSPQEHLEKVKNPKFNYENFKTTMCKTCHDAEKNTGGSMRTGYHNMFKHLPKTDKPRLLQIGFGNFCNFKCRYCTPRFSTTWNEDTPFMNQIREKNRHNSESFGHTYTKITNTEQQTFDIEKEIVKQVESLDLSELVYLGVFGGEPFLSRHWQALVEVLEQKNRSI
jgi:sulfatase maturation enzyme AslB (radical SAM superfamily)